MHLFIFSKKKKKKWKTSNKYFVFTEYSLNSAALSLFVTECAMQAKIKKNKISRVLFLVQKALLSYKQDATNRGTKQLLEVSI